MSVKFSEILIMRGYCMESLDNIKPQDLHLFFGSAVDQIPLLLSGEDEEGKKIDGSRKLITSRELLYNDLHDERNRMLLNGASRGLNLYTGDAIIFDLDGNEEAIIGRYSIPSVKELVNSINPEGHFPPWLKIYGIPRKLEVSTDHYQTIKKDDALVINSAFAERLMNDGPKAMETLLDYLTEGSAELVREYKSSAKFYVEFNSKRTRPGLTLLSFRRRSKDEPFHFDFVDLDNDHSVTIGVADPADVTSEPLESMLEEYTLSLLKEGKPFQYRGVLYTPFYKRRDSRRS